MVKDSAMAKASVLESARDSELALDSEWESP
jgi:hypothetical protein